MERSSNPSPLSRQRRFACTDTGDTTYPRAAYAPIDASVGVAAATPASDLVSGYRSAALIGQDGAVIEHAERPWGSYTVLAEGDGFKVKTIEIRPGQRLSYQRHKRRAEHWFVVAGQGVITLDGRTIEARPGNSVDVPCGAAHRIRNTGPVPLVFVEVQHGDYFGEDDIVRLDDDYGRLEAGALSAD